MWQGHVICWYIVIGWMDVNFEKLTLGSLSCIQCLIAGNNCSSQKSKWNIVLCIQSIIYTCDDAVFNINKKWCICVNTILKRETCLYYTSVKNDTGMFKCVHEDVDLGNMYLTLHKCWLFPQTWNVQYSVTWCMMILEHSAVW